MTGEHGIRWTRGKGGRTLALPSNQRALIGLVGSIIFFIFLMGEQGPILEGRQMAGYRIAGSLRTIRWAVRLWILCLVPGATLHVSGQFGTYRRVPLRLIAWSVWLLLTLASLMSFALLLAGVGSATALTLVFICAGIMAFVPLIPLNTGEKAASRGWRMISIAAAVILILSGMYLVLLVMRGELEYSGYVFILVSMDLAMIVMLAGHLLQQRLARSPEP